MKICITGPIATEDVLPLVDGPLPPVLPAGYGGAPLTAVLIDQLLRAGHSVVAITVDYSMPPQLKPVVLKGVRFEFQVHPGRRRAWRWNEGRPGRAVDLFRCERQLLAQAIAACAPDVVHAHWTYEFALGALDSGVPHLVTTHDSPRQVLSYSRNAYRAIRWLMAQQVARRAKLTSAVSSYMAAEWRSLSHKQAMVVPNPVAGYVLDLGRARLHLASRSVALVSNGWGSRKNVAAGLQGFAQFRRLSRPVEGAMLELPQLHCYGADFGPGELAEQFAIAHNLADGVSFHGRLSHRQLIDRLREQDALLHPALEESFGVVLAEAMALGLPVVAGRRSGAVPWVVGADAHGDAPAAILVDVTSADAIAKGLAELFDDGYARRSSAAVQQVRLRFDPAVVAAGYLALYEQAVTEQRTRPGGFSCATEMPSP